MTLSFPVAGFQCHPGNDTFAAASEWELDETCEGWMLDGDKSAKRIGNGI